MDMFGSCYLRTPGEAFMRCVIAISIHLVSLGVPTAASAQARTELNVIYGMYSGAALLMDVYVPERPNGFGIITIAGTGWHLPTAYESPGQKERIYAADSAALLAAGYTVFQINHRAAPRFRYPAALEDAQRAVRFIRFHAARFGVDPARLGGWGFSSGAHIVALLGVLDGAGDPVDPDPVNRLSAKLQCIVAGALPSDLSRTSGQLGVVAASFLGNPTFSLGPVADDNISLARAASPLHHVTPDDPPFLLEHGDADEIVPFAQSELMEEALRRVGVTVRLRRVAGGDHGGPRFAAQDPEVRYAAIIGWFDEHLRNRR
jgi:acetyl esterase/lipase